MFDITNYTAANIVDAANDELNIIGLDPNEFSSWNPVVDTLTSSLTGLQLTDGTEIDAICARLNETKEGDSEVGDADSREWVITNNVINQLADGVLFNTVLSSSPCAWAVVYEARFPSETAMFHYEGGRACVRQGRYSGFAAGGSINGDMELYADSPNITLGNPPHNIGAFPELDDDANLVEAVFTVNADYQEVPGTQVQVDIAFVSQSKDGGYSTSDEAILAQTGLTFQDGAEQTIILPINANLNQGSQLGVMIGNLNGTSEVFLNFDDIKVTYEM